MLFALYGLHLHGGCKSKQHVPQQGQMEKQGLGTKQRQARAWHRCTAVQMEQLHCGDLSSINRIVESFRLEKTFEVIRSSH